MTLYKTIPVNTRYKNLIDFTQLTKLRLSISIVLSSIAGYFLAAEEIDYPSLVLLTIGGFSMVGASNVFNQIFEKDLDKKMLRTQNRPLPDGRVQPKTAMYLGVMLTLIGVVCLYLINLKTAFFACISTFLYACLYTPLKQKTPLSVFVGAFPGAIPFMLGWVAATNKFGIEPGLLFMLQFFWQFPHFWAIGWLMHDQYESAGFKMLPSGSKDQSTAFQVVFYTLWTILISLIPSFRFTGVLYLTQLASVIILLLGIMFFYFAINLMLSKTDKSASLLIKSSIIYITGVQVVYVLDKLLFQ